MHFLSDALSFCQFEAQIFQSKFLIDGGDFYEEIVNDDDCVCKTTPFLHDLVCWFIAPFLEFSQLKGLAKPRTSKAYSCRK